MLGASETTAYLKLRDFFQGYVLPMKGKKPDAAMSKRQRGTKTWKNHADSFYQRPPTRAEVTEWATEGCGIGGIMGERSGIVALEIDLPRLFLPLLLASLPEFETPIAKSPSGGFHYLFRYGPHVKNLSVGCPVFNDEASPCYAGKRELASMRANDQLIALPPGPGREWLPDRSITKTEPVVVPPDLIDFLRRFPESRGKGLPIEQGAEVPPNRTLTPVLLDTVLLEDTGRYVLLQVSPAVLKLATDKNSRLIRPLVKRLGGKGLRVPCPYHPPDNKASASFWHNKSGWYLADHHFTPSHNQPVSQLCADLVTGFLERCRNGSENRYQHRVYSLRKDGTYKVDVQSFVWLAFAAADLGIITLPSSRFPQKLEGFTPDGERILRFIDKWERAHRYTFNYDVFPLARTFLIPVLFALPAPGKDEPKTPEWNAAYKEVDKAVNRAWRLGLEKVEPGVKGFGGKPALYRVCTTNGGNQ